MLFRYDKSIILAILMTMIICTALAYVSVRAKGNATLPDDSSSEHRTAVDHVGMEMPVAPLAQSQ